MTVDEAKAIALEELVRVDAFMDMYAIYSLGGPISDYCDPEAKAWIDAAEWIREASK